MTRTTFRQSRLRATTSARTAAKPRPRAAASAAKADAKPARATKQPKPGLSGAHALEWTDTLLDGTHVLIRPIKKDDIELERAFIKFLSPEARRMRFLGMINEGDDALLHCLTDIDYKQQMAFVALVHRNGETQEIGVSRYGTSIDGKSCECAVTVSDAWRHRGLATLLMRHLIEHARAQGIRTMVSFDAVRNNEMRELAAFLGFKRESDPDDATMVVHSLTL